MPNLSVHLIPAATDTAELQLITERLAHDFNGPNFPPHITIFWGSVPVPSDLIAASNSIAGNMSSLSLPVTGLDFGQTFTSTLFLTFPKTEQLIQLHNRFAPFHSSPSYDFNPHLSLLYANIGKDEKAVLKRNLQLPISEITFDELRVVEARASYSSREDIESERVIHAVKLLSKRNDV